MSGKIVLIVVHRKKLILPLLIILGISMLLMASRKNYVTSAVSHLFYDNIIAIDPGHGGIDGGTFQSGLLEKDINLDISLKIKKVLQHQNITAFPIESAKLYRYFPNFSSRILPFFHLLSSIGEYSYILSFRRKNKLKRNYNFFTSIVQKQHKSMDVFHP
ncbi:N-acetylmuramoyl-L-alanine amidase [Thermotalea metallivorans]|uniref:MurNAc-LAA domain-containing protein n=1 Tax=Thermotalea metallivorans TaxID=520762 RepID=A0A140LB57_9FIRM|nr:N-acetylmuramoyl-L-alanine amidase [Thermotalea metallivorans]KXG77782.1 hypothetical protein AN619_03840 [Thermotalea metallivorans]